MTTELRATVKRLYTGTGRQAVWFRYGLIAFDAASILFFLLTASVEHGPVLTTISFATGLVILLDFLARLWIAPDRVFMLRQIYSIADVIVIFSLLLDPFYSGTLAFLRVLRGLRLIHSYHLLRDMRRDVGFFRDHEDSVIAATNLFVFVFFTTSVVHVIFFEPSNGVGSYIDALYFTVATLTTTGFGDITLATPTGKMISVVIMVVGVALFLQLVRAIFQPQKVRYACPGCGLDRHEVDAVHCKHCGGLLKIRTSGVS